MTSQTVEFDTRLRRIKREYNKEWRRQNGQTFTALLFGAIGRQIGFLLLLALALLGSKVGLAMAIGEPEFGYRLALMAQGDVMERTLAFFLSPDLASDAVRAVITYIGEMDTQVVVQ